MPFLLGNDMISIIITTYNDSEFLFRSLTSCVMQEVEKEIILVDDCSTVSFSENLIEFIEENNIKLIRQPTNMLVSAARNAGIEAAKYDLIITLDADDFLIPNSLTKLMLHVDDSHQIFYGRNTVIDPTSGKIKPVKPVSIKLIEDDFKIGNPVFATSLFRKEVWEKIDGYTVLEYPHYEDYNFWAKAFSKGFNFKYCPVNVYHHYERKNNTSNQVEHMEDKLRELAIKGMFK